MTAVGDDIDISWNDLSGQEEGYDVQRRINGGSWTTVSSENAGVTSFTHLDVVCHQGEVYDYRIRVYDTPTSMEDFSPTRIWRPCMLPKIGSVGASAFIPQTLVDFSEQVPELRGAYPNPFNPVTTLSFRLPSEMVVNLTVYDALGRTVKVLTNGLRGAGTHTASFDASDLPSGVYFYILTTPESRQHKSLLLMK